MPISYAETTPLTAKPSDTFGARIQAAISAMCTAAHPDVASSGRCTIAESPSRATAAARGEARP